MTTQKFIDGPLTLEVRDEDDNLWVVWTGRSVARNPSEVILPVLLRAVESGHRDEKPVTIDFRGLEYLNSSTITPVIRALDQAKEMQTPVTILYRLELKWQALSFTPLQVLQTADGCITIRGD